jgi:hypothetical protein
MKRVVVNGGSVILVENLPVARTKAQEAHLQLFKCKVKYTSGELDFLPKEELTEMFERVGFRRIEVKELEYNLSAAPPLFYLPYYISSLTKSQREAAEEAYNKAVNTIRKWGEVSPPAILVRATK